MDFWTVLRTILEKNPGIAAKKLIEKLRGRLHLSRSTIYERLGSLDLQGKIEREKGRYYLKGQKPLPSSILLERESALFHSVLLIPALERIAGLYSSSFYYDEEDNKEGDPFINDECALAHLRFYPEIWDLYEKYRIVKKECVATKARNQLYNQILERLYDEFGEVAIDRSRLALFDYPDEYVDIKLVSSIVAQIIRGTIMQIDIFKNEMRFGESYLAHGNRRFLSNVRDFFEREIGNESNLVLATEIKRTREEHSKIKKKFQDLVKRLIAKIEHRRPLKGKCEICSKSSF